MENICEFGCCCCKYKLEARAYQPKEKEFNKRIEEFYYTKLKEKDFKISEDEFHVIEKQVTIMRNDFKKELDAQVSKNSENKEQTGKTTILYKCGESYFSVIISKEIAEKGEEEEKIKKMVEESTRIHNEYLKRSQ